MKKIFLLFFVCLITLGAFGQTKEVDPRRISLSTNTADIVMPGVYVPSENPISRAPNEQIIGKTLYDTQSNGSLGSRFHRFDDGRIVATWTGGVQDAPNLPDRGSFYNYFDGNSWTTDPDNVVRIEDVRSGWPSWAPLGNGEVIASHDAGTVNLWARSTVGTGTWTKKSTLTGANVWARICVNDGVIHMITAESIDDAVPLFYSKSTDGGETWTPQRAPIATILPDYDYNPGCYHADSYVWAEPVNGIIALALAGNAGDLVIYKSADNGATWEKKVAWYTPRKNEVYPFDYTHAPSGLSSLVIDNDGKCHLAFTVCVSSGGSHSLAYYSYAYYWNEDMPIFSNSDPYVALDPDENPQYAEDGRLVLSMSFIGEDILDDYYVNSLVLYSPFGAIHKLHMAAAGPDRMILVFAIQDHTTMHYSGYFFSRIFACSYIKDGNDWKFDTTWANDIADWGYPGWLRVNKDTHADENCTHPQIVVEKTDDDSGKFYILYMVDDTPGGALEGADGGNNNPQYGIYTDNYFVVYSDDVSSPGGETPPKITTTILPNGKKGVTYNQTLKANGSKPITWSIENENDLPPGLTFASTGVISGKPTEADTVPTLYTFKVKVTNDLGEDEKELSITIEAEPLIGINAYENSPIKVYPNPANDILYIVNENQQSMQVKLFDFMGREVLNQNITDKTGIDVKKLPAGIYNLTIKYGNTVENRRIVKN